MKILSRLLLAAMFIVGAFVANISSASAQGTPCTLTYGTSQVYACASVYNGYAGAYMQAYDGGFHNYTLAIEQCRTDLTNCIAFSATSGSSSQPSVSIPAKPCSPTHLYRVRASWTDSRSGHPYVDARSAWTTC